MVQACCIGTQCLMLHKRILLHAAIIPQINNINSLVGNGATDGPDHWQREDGSIRADPEELKKGSGGSNTDVLPYP